MLPLTTLEKNIRENLKHNVTVGLWDGGLFGAALGFASFGTILPLFVASMTTSAILIGLVPAIHSVGWQLPQLFTASYVSRLRRYKRNVIMKTIHERVPFLGFAIVALLLPTIGLQAGLIITFILLTWQGLGGGFTANSWTSMISKIIPPETRGTFFGFQAGIANLFISGSAVGAGYLLDYLDSPIDFAVCFFIASIFFTLSWFALALTREPEDTEKIIPEEKTHFWDDSKNILRKDPNFNWFLAARFLSQFATMGFSFYIIYALRRFNMDAVTAGFLTATLTISQTIANVGMGWLGDRMGHRAMLIIGAIAALLSSILAWLAHIHRMVLSHLSSCGPRQRFHLDNRHDNDSGLRHGSRTSALHWSLTNTHRARHHHRSPARRLDRGLSRFHSNIFNFNHSLHCDDRHSYIFSKRSTHTQTIDHGQRQSMVSGKSIKIIVNRNQPARLNEDADYPISCMPSITGLSCHRMIYF